MNKIVFAFLFIMVSLLTTSSGKAQVIGGGGGGGVGKSFMQALFPANKPCEDGEMRLYQEYDTSEDHYITVQRVCRQGTFFEKSNIDYKKIRCTEGTLGVAEVRLANGNYLKQTFRCIKGKRTLIRAEEIAGTSR